MQTRFFLRFRIVREWGRSAPSGEFRVGIRNFPESAAAVLPVFDRDQKKVSTAPSIRSRESTSHSSGHLSKVVHGWEMPNPTRSPTRRG